MDVGYLSNFDPLIKYQLTLDEYQFLVCFQLEAQLASWVACSLFDPVERTLLATLG
jgi:hypothetical protein